KKRGVKQHRTEIKLSPSGKEQGKGFRIRATPAPSPGASRHLLPVFERYPQVVRWTRASGTTCGKGEVPSLAKEGWPRHQVNGPIPLKARPGWFVQLPIIGGLNQPPRLRPLRRLRGIFLMGAATPPCARRGLRLSLQLSSMPPCPAKDVGHSKASLQGGVAERFRKYREASAYREAGVVFR